MTINSQTWLDKGHRLHESCACAPTPARCLGDSDRSACACGRMSASTYSMLTTSLRLRLEGGGWSPEPLRLRLGRDFAVLLQLECSQIQFKTLVRDANAGIGLRNQWFHLAFLIGIL